MTGGRWIAYAGFAYVGAWLIGLIIGFATSSPSPTDSAQQIGTYFGSHRVAAMIQAYFLDGIAGASFIAFGGRSGALYDGTRAKAARCPASCSGQP